MSKIHFSPVKGLAEEIIQAVMDTPEVQSVPPLEFTLQLVVEEIVVNIVSYAYPVGKDGEVTIDVNKTPTAIEISFSDRGVPFNPLEKEDPDTTLSAEERPIGGLGIFLVKQMMDSVSYRYEDGHNILTTTKNI